MQRVLPFGLIVFVVLVAGCRGTEHGQPPIHPNLNMDFQERFDPQEGNPFFADKRAMRPTVPGTIPRGFLREDRAFYEGRGPDGSPVARIPVPVTRDLLERGQERYDIYCAPCHGAAGDGQGIITTGGFGYTPAPSYHDDRLRAVTDGHMYDVIVYGIRTMPPYGSQVAVADRWAIVAYIRALQRSQHASLEDVPASVRQTLRPTTGSPDSGAAPDGSDAAADTASAAADTASAAAAEAQQ